MNTEQSAEAARDKIRLNKFIAASGYTSRRKADDLIASGAVAVNGVIVNKMGISINPKVDKVMIGMVKIDGMPEKVYYLLNKPKGYICANETQHEDKLVTELLPDMRLSTVGRLDKNTEGLLIVTNDGDFLHKIAHPSNKCEKEYEIRINKITKKEDIDKLKNGIEIEVERIQTDRKTSEKYIAKAKKVETIKNDGKPTIIHITIEEGRKRQIRLMMERIGYKYMDLKRIRIGSIKLGNLKTGTYRSLTQDEINSLLH
ncbi:MAG: pseudouridine synthase [Candidatus Peregrinibacteria bacterium]|nr:pseudouridine synthase [Candidatus Peregrinibacteria bacterium]MDZ4244986.1 pseudouridine synthase [Candidatus Gracilibacteria bacterium]